MTSTDGRDALAAGFAASPGVPEQVADHLSDLIVRGELASGERIAEARITAALGVSRGSVREALLILARRHLVEMVPRRGAVVSELTAASIEGLYDVTIALYTLLARSAATAWRGAAELAPFHDLSDRAAAAAAGGDVAAVVACTFEFTDAGCELVANPYLTETLARLRPAFNRTHRLVLQAGHTELDVLLEFLGGLMGCIERRDGDGAERVVRRYGEHQRALALAALAERAGAPAD